MIVVREHLSIGRRHELGNALATTIVAVLALAIARFDAEDHLDAARLGPR